MKISTFCNKHPELGINYMTIHRLIKNKTLKENIHYVKYWCGVYEKYKVRELALLKFFKGGR